MIEDMSFSINHQTYVVDDLLHFSETAFFADFFKNSEHSHGSSPADSKTKRKNWDLSFSCAPESTHLERIGANLNMF